MKRTALTLLISLLAALFLVAGCASAPQPDDRKGDSASDRYDRDYMGAVEEKARAYGAKVYWTSPPRRSSRRDKDESESEGEGF